MKRIISLLIMAVMLMSMAVTVNPVTASASSWFSDVPQNKWYYNSIKYVCDNQLMNGTTTTEFAPEEDFSRAMLVTVLWRKEGSPKASASVFDDVPNGKFYTKAVAWASANGIVTGVGGGKFKPNDPVTREEMTTIFMRYAKFLSIDTSARTDISHFSDATKISKFAKASMNWAITLKLVNGVSKTVLNPKGNATRAQSAAILERFCKEVLVDVEQTPTPDPDPTPEDDGPDGPYVENEDGNIIETPDHNVNDDYIINGTVTNDNGFIPDEEQGLAKSERFATEQSKYSFDNNPLINRDRQVNREALPSFDINETGFVRAGTKISDLKGKKLEFFTADNFAAWSYRNAKGETIDEWTWFKDLKDEIGLTIKFTIKQHQNSINAVLQNMNAGKQCDVIYTNRNILPQALCISKSITSLVNINNLGSSPGVCKKTMDQYKWGNTLRLIAPIGPADVLWYNQTLNQELNLSDPHVMWEMGKWNWDAFRKYIFSVPKATRDGNELVAFTGFPQEFSETFALTNGKAVIQNNATAEIPTVQNNWSDPQVLAAFEFIASVTQVVNYKCTPDADTVFTKEYLGLFEGTTLMTTTMYTQVYRDTEYSKHIQINWVPYPKASTETGKEVAVSMGYGMLLPSKTAKPDNENTALKFMELWATRYTETFFDNLNTFEYYNFNYKQRYQYFNFVTQNTMASLAGCLSFNKYGNVIPALQGNAAYNVKTEATKYANEMAKDLSEIIKYGN